MPNPSWLPIIGSGPNAFGDIGGQQRSFAQFNAGIESDNLARAAQAQREANNWLATQAQWQRADQENASRDQLLAYERDARAAADAEKRREFDVGVGLSKDQMAADKEKYNWHFKLADAEQKRQLSTVENTAKFLAKDAKDFAEQFKDTTSELRDATDALDTSASGIKPSGLIIFGKNRQFTPSALSVNDPRALQEAAEANAKLAADKSRYDQAVQNYRLRLSNWQELRKRAAASGLEVSDDGTVYSPFHDKTYGSPLKQPVAESKPATEERPRLPSWLQPIDMGFMGANAPTMPSPFNVPSPAVAPPPVAPSAPSGGGVQRVVRGPDGRLMLAPVNQPNVPSVFVQGAY